MAKQDFFSQGHSGNKNQKKKKDKARKSEERRANAGNKKSLDDMIAYVDEYGNLSSTPPDLEKKKKILSEEVIEVSVPRREESTEEEAARNGVVTFFDGSKGYGFIRDSKTQESLFSHVTNQLDKVSEGDKVTYDVQHGPKGLVAVNVRLVK